MSRLSVYWHKRVLDADRETRRDSVLKRLLPGAYIISRSSRSDLSSGFMTSVYTASVAVKQNVASGLALGDAVTIGAITYVVVSITEEIRGPFTWLVIELESGT